MTCGRSLLVIELQSSRVLGDGQLQEGIAKYVSTHDAHT